MLQLNPSIQTVNTQVSEIVEFYKMLMDDLQKKENISIEQLQNTSQQALVKLNPEMASHFSHTLNAPKQLQNTNEKKDKPVTSIYFSSLGKAAIFYALKKGAIKLQKNGLKYILEISLPYGGIIQYCIAPAIGFNAEFFADATNDYFEKKIKASTRFIGDVVKGILGNTILRLMGKKTETIANTNTITIKATIRSEPLSFRFNPNPYSNIPETALFYMALTEGLQFHIKNQKGPITLTVLHCYAFSAAMYLSPTAQHQIFPYIQSQLMRGNPMLNDKNNADGAPAYKLFLQGMVMHTLKKTAIKAQKESIPMLVPVIADYALMGGYPVTQSILFPAAEYSVEFISHIAKNYSDEVIRYFGEQCNKAKLQLFEKVDTQCQKLANIFTKGSEPAVETVSQIDPQASILYAFSLSNQPMPSTQSLRLMEPETQRTGPKC